MKLGLVLDRDPIYGVKMSIPGIEGHEFEDLPGSN